MRLLFVATALEGVEKLIGKRLIEVGGDPDATLPAARLTRQTPLGEGRQSRHVSRAMGLPALVMMISSPAAARSTSFESEVLASWRL
jgi:hypothetical protein